MFLLYFMAETGILGTKKKVSNQVWKKQGGIMAENYNGMAVGVFELDNLVACYVALDAASKAATEIPVLGNFRGSFCSKQHFLLIYIPKFLIFCHFQKLRITGMGQQYLLASSVSLQLLQLSIIFF